MINRPRAGNFATLKNSNSQNIEPIFLANSKESFKQEKCVHVFHDKLRHGPFPTLKTAIFIKIAKIIKIGYQLFFYNIILKVGARCAIFFKLSLFPIGFLNF